MLRDGSPDCHSSGAGTFAGQMRRRGVLVLDQVSRSRNHVVNRVLLRQFLAADVPILAILATAPHVRYSVYAVALEEGQQSRLEPGIERDSVRSITFQPCGM